MQEAAKDLVGTHDFTGFTASGTSVENKVRTITQASVSIDEKTGFYIFTFSGNGFLYKQVRNMVGTLLKIGNGRMPVSQVKTVLDSAKLEGRMEGHMEGHMEGLAEGEAKGKAEANLENAKKMKAMGIDLEMIRQITGITL